MKFLLSLVIVFMSESGPLHVQSDFAYFTDKANCVGVGEHLREQIVSAGASRVDFVCYKEGNDAIKEWNRD